jgi:putative endonuclease
MSYFFYILYSEKCDKYYIGQTEFLERRLEEHNTGKGGAFSKVCAPWRLVYHEVFSSRLEAIKREREVKSKKSRSYLEFLISSVG